MRRIISILLFNFPHTAFATLWITVSDPQTNKIGVVGVSSGYIGDYRTMVPVDNHGVAVVGSWYLGKDQQALVDLLKNSSLTARETAEKFSYMINRDSYKRRVSLVNARFENASVPGRGCHEHNYYCGKFEDQDFTITGGGLESENVILSAARTLQASSTKYLPIECQLYAGINAVIQSGAEIKRLERLSFYVDDLHKLNDGEIRLIKRKGAEEGLLRQFRNEIEARGINCPWNN